MKRDRVEAGGDRLKERNCKCKHGTEDGRRTDKTREATVHAATVRVRSPGEVGPPTFAHGFLDMYIPSLSTYKNINLSHSWYNKTVTNTTRYLTYVGSGCKYATVQPLPSCSLRFLREGGLQ